MVPCDGAGDNRYSCMIEQRIPTEKGFSRSVRPRSFASVAVARASFRDAPFTNVSS